ncbi:hypothetical protein EVAR_55462_1 [Eumeta japonica]|uniref:Uncharacterized protein n=1 Tax=Eumeta variegata TaxID=151549 RepID=A0A4C1Y5N1_EUMVA|nr:hypothetical protein EVAR_55462_1 [Eumeta japonica]
MEAVDSTELAPAFPSRTNLTNMKLIKMLPFANDLSLFTVRYPTRKHDADSFCFISGEFIKLHMLHSHLDEFKHNTGSNSEEQGELCRQDVIDLRTAISRARQRAYDG